MKKIIIIAILFLSLCGVYYYVNVWHEKNDLGHLSELTLSNIEALSGIESFPGSGDECYTIIKEFEDSYQSGEEKVIVRKWEEYNCYKGSGFQCKEGVIYYVVNGKPCYNCGNVAYLNCM